MKFVVVDVQGYSLPDFYVKELAITDGKELKTYVFKPPISWSTLGEDQKKHVIYMEKEHHGFSYDYGETDYDEIYSILCQGLRDVDTIYVKGRVEKKFLEKNFLEKTLSDIKYKLPKIVILKRASKCVPKIQKDMLTCGNHRLFYCICSANNAYVIYNNIINLLPK